MLYDPKWEIKINADAFSTANLVMWLETKDPNESYAWHCQGECLLAQWIKSIDPSSAEDPDGDSMSYLVHGKPMDFGKFSDIALYGESNFGAALARARDAVA